MILAIVISAVVCAVGGFIGGLLFMEPIVRDRERRAEAWAATLEQALQEERAARREEAFR